MPMTAIEPAMSPRTLQMICIGVGLPAAVAGLGRDERAHKRAELPLLTPQGSWAGAKRAKRHLGGHLHLAGALVHVPQVTGLAMERGGSLPCPFVGNMARAISFKSGSVKPVRRSFYGRHVATEAL